MALSDELRAQILRYHFVEHWRVGTIAASSAFTTPRALGEAGVERIGDASKLAAITETLERFPTLTAARLFDMVKVIDHFRHRIAPLRPRRPRERGAQVEGSPSDAPSAP